MPSEVIGGVIGGVGDLGAAAFEARAIDKAADVQRETDAAARADLQPFRDAGAGILGPLQDQALNDPFDMGFEQQEGFRAIQNSAAAGGRLGSGGTLKALTDYQTGLSAQFDQQKFNKLFNLASMGSNAAARTATNTLNTGANMSNLYLAKGNSQANALGNVGNRLMGLFGP